MRVALCAEERGGAAAVRLSRAAERRQPGWGHGLRASESPDNVMAAVLNGVISSVRLFAFSLSILQRVCLQN